LCQKGLLKRISRGYYALEVESGKAGKSTLNRLELTTEDAGKESRYKKIVYQGEKIERFFIDAFLRSHKEKPERIVLDLDATDDPMHGNQEGRFFSWILWGVLLLTPVHIL